MLITRIKCDTIAVHVQSLSGISSATLTPSDWAVKATIISLLLSNHSSRPFLPRLDLFPQTNTTTIKRPEAAEQSSAVQLVIWEVGSLEMSDRCPMTHAVFQRRLLFLAPSLKYPPPPLFLSLLPLPFDQTRYGWC